MAESVKITIPASVAAFVRPGTPQEERLRGAGGVPSLPAREQLLLLFCLSKDSDPLVRDQAQQTLAALDEAQVTAAVSGWDGVHPALLHSVALSHGDRVVVRELLLVHPGLADATRTLLMEKKAYFERFAAETPVPEPLAASVAEGDAPGDHEGEGDLPEQPADAEDAEAEVNEEGEEYLSKYQLAQVMGIGEKIKMALTGDKEWRKILVKDANKLVSGGVLKNPRMTEPEVLTVLKSGAQNDEIMRLICANKEWVKNYQIRKALVENPKTPLANALRYLSSLNEKDIANYAKSRNISSVISTQAKRMLLNKKK